jgi:integrase
MSTKSSGKRASGKLDRPKKPYPDFPLSSHASGKWQKKIRGKIHYFGRWAKRVNGKLERVPGDGWEEALRLYKAQADDLHAGRTPRVTNPDGLTVKELCNRFLTAKTRKMEAGELSPRSFAEYKQTTDRLIAQLGKDRLVDDLASDDFESLRADFAKRWGPVRLGNEIGRVKTIFKYALDNALIDRPVRFGSEFKKPGKAVLRKHRAKNGERMFERDEILTLIAAADPVVSAMIHLGVNCGFGNTDVADLQRSHLDLANGWIDFPRPKTGIERRCPLWPDTVKALRKAIDVRPEARDDDDADCVFLTVRGRRWVKVSEKARTDTVTAAFGSLLRQLGINGRKGLGFYTLRHVFRTIADESRDRVAIDTIMGHSDPSMGAAYRERIDDDRLRAVADHVRGWLFQDAEESNDG